MGKSYSVREAQEVKSIIQTEKECFLCKKYFGESVTQGLHEHHVCEGWANRRVSERLGLKVWLCPPHHNMSDHGVHFNPEIGVELKKIAQRKYEETHSREEWMAEIGRNYLEDDD